MEKKRLIVTALVLVAAIAITLFLTKGYWWPFVYDNLFSPYTPPFICAGWNPKNVIAQEGSYVETFFTAENASSEYPESWLADKNLLKGYSRFYGAIWVGIGRFRNLVEGSNNQTILKMYIFEYKSEKIAKNIFEKSSLETTDMGGRGVKIKYGPNKYVWQSNECVVYIAAAEGFESLGESEMRWILDAHTYE